MLQRLIMARLFGSLSPRTARAALSDFFLLADVRLDGNRPWDIRAKDERFFTKVLRGGSLGLGESYVEELWDCDKLDELFYKVLNARLDTQFPKNLSEVARAVRTWVWNPQTKRKSRYVAEQHYDFGNEFYESFLDPYNQYTCGYFEEGDGLNEAQARKMDLICKKLRLSAKDRVLDIGCGWGGFAKFAAERYGCHVTGISISDRQIEYAKEFCRNLPVEIRKCDYRNLEGSFDKVLICGMIEHVGVKNYRTLMEVVHRSLRNDGLFLLHTIGNNRAYQYIDPWIAKYIFPNSMIPALSQLSKAFEGFFVLEDLHAFGHHYDKTLASWDKNLESSWTKLSVPYPSSVRRMWKYYFLSCAGAFRARALQVWQFLFSREGIMDGLAAVR